MSVIVFREQASAFGTEVINGGQAVVCRSNGEIRSVKLFDYVESLSLRNFSPTFDSTNNDAKQILATLIQRLEEISPLRAAVYRSRAETFFDEARFLTDMALVPIEDAHPIALPKDCAVEQLASQKNPEFIGDSRYFIDQSLWQRLSSVDQAGLMFHEILYREAREYGQTTSSSVRYLNSFFAADLQKRLDSYIAIHELFLSTVFAMTDFNGWNFILLTCANDSKPAGACPGGKEPYQELVQFGIGKALTGKALAPSGQLPDSTKLPWKVWIDQGAGTPVQTSFYADGRLESVREAALHVKTVGDTIVTAQGVKLYDSEQGNARCLDLGESPQTFLTSDRRNVRYQSTIVELDQSGYVIHSATGYDTVSEFCRTLK